MATVSIFVSHNRTDNAFCQAMVDALQVAGADVWYDERNLGAVELRKTIERELRRRLIFIVVLSPDALTSEWVYDECNWAYSLYKRDLERSRIILPVVARPINEDAIWLFLADFKRVEDSGATALPQQVAIQRTLSLLALSSSSAINPISSADTFTIDDLLDRGTALLAQKRNQEALTIFEAVIMLAPQHSFAWSSKARVLFYLNRNKASLIASEESIRLNPRNAIGWNYKGAAFAKLKRYKDALTNYNQALMLDDAYGFAWYNKGNILYDMHCYQEALAAYNQALIFDPDDADTWSNKGLTLTKMHRYKDALISYNHALALKPNDSGTRHNKRATLMLSFIKRFTSRTKT